MAKIMTNVSTVLLLVTILGVSYQPVHGFTSTTTTSRTQSIQRYLLPVTTSVSNTDQRHSLLSLSNKNKRSVLFLQSNGSTTFDNVDNPKWSQNGRWSMSSSAWRLKKTRNNNNRARNTSTTTTRLSMIGMDMTVAKASLSATAKLLSSIGLGGLAAVKPNLLDAAAISALSRLTYWVFQPAFLFCSVSKTLYAAGSGGLSLRALWLMPVLGVVQIMAGAVVGRFLAAVFGIRDPDEVPNVRMCTTFANSGPLPLIFADALFSGNAVLQSQMAAGISFYLLAWSPLFWTLGKIILGTNGDSTTGTKDDENTSVLSKMSNSVTSMLKTFLSPPVVGSLVGLVVGLIGPLRGLFFDQGILQPLYGALHTLGTAYLPAALMVLAGSLVGKRSTAAENDDSSSKTKPSGRAMAAIAIYRFILSPLITWGVASILQGLSWMDARTKSIVTFLCLMEGCMPPAQNSVIMLQLVGKTSAATALAKLLTIMYAGAVIPVTLLLTACLQQSGILAYL